MGLFSFLKRNRTDDKPTAKSPSADEVQRARTRARQRLTGAVVLLGVGVIGFPLLFETQPRPIPVDIPIEIPRKDGAPPLAVPAPRSASKPAAKVITETAADADKEVPAAAPVASAVADKPTRVASAPAETRETAAKPARSASPPEAREAAKAASAPANDAARARALLEDQPTAKVDERKPAEEATKDGRFIVQVGAFADANAARETRLKVEKLGLKTYTQVVDTDAGKRIRVRIGPFANRDEADKVAGKIKSAGLPSAVLTL